MSCTAAEVQLLAPAEYMHLDLPMLSTTSVVSARARKAVQRSCL